LTVEEILSDLGVRFARHGESAKVTLGWVGVPCPFCGHGGGEAYLGFPVDGRFASCWNCGVHKFIDALMAVSGAPYRAVAALVGEMGPDPTPRPKTRPRGRLIQPRGICPLGPAHRDYLSRRGFDPDQIHQLWKVSGLGWDGRCGERRLPWRLFIPVTLFGEEVSWTTRSISDADPARRYTSALPEEERLPAREILYGADLCRHACILVEGPTSAWAVGPGAAASLGVGWSRPQMARLGAFPVRAVCFDAEPAARARARRLCRELEALPGRTENVVLETGKDPACAAKWEIEELRRRYLE
jgi:hypothetical protein